MSRQYFLMVRQQRSQDCEKVVIIDNIIIDNIIDIIILTRTKDLEMEPADYLLQRTTSSN